MPDSGHIRATRLQVTRDHARFSKRDTDALPATALRTRSVYAREILAELAWPGHSVDELLKHISRADGALPTGASASRAGRLAYVLALQAIESNDGSNARTILEAVNRDLGIESLPRRQAETLAQLRLMDGDVAGATAIARTSAMTESVASAIEVDALNPIVSGGDVTSPWLARLNAFLHGDRVEPVALDESAPAGRSAFDRLTTEHPACVDSPTRVTIAISSYRPGPGLLTAVTSAIRQTWTNLEILVVDDASGPAYDAVLDEVGAMDPRVRVIRKAINGGTYRARNTALRQATGDVFTTLDSDDWFHPQAVEQSIQPLLNSTDVVATRHLGVRVPESLWLTRTGYLPRFRTAHSLMFRTSEVVNRIGLFDPTRKGADTEYARRIALAFSRRIHEIPMVLTIVRAGASLSSSEFSARWRHGSRHAYKSTYAGWHSHIKNGTADPFLDPNQPRLFPEPRRWADLPSTTTEAPHHVDVCFAGDWRRYGGPQRSMLAEIDAALQGGLTVGIMQLEAFRFMTARDDALCIPILKRIRSGDVEWLQIDDNVEIDVLLVRYPPVLQYPPRVERPAQVGTVIVVANQAPLEPDGSDQRYVVSDVTERANETFRAPVHWLPQSPLIREILECEDPTVPLLGWDNPGLINVAEWERQRPSPIVEKPVVGRYSRDDEIKFPATFADLLRAYDFGPEYSVRFMGGPNRVRRLIRDQGLGDDALPRNWQLLAHRAMDVHQFLEGIDFFVYYDNPNRFEAFGRVLLEAAASGVVTIADPRHRRTFGDALDYAPPGGAQELVAQYVADPGRYAARSIETRELVAERFGYRCFIEKLRPLLRGDVERSQLSPALPEVQLTIDDLGPLRPIQVEVAAPLHALHVPIRTLADASLMDELVLMVREHTRDLRRWSDRFVTGPGHPLARAEALETAPPELLSVVSRDGTSLQILTRDDYTAESSVGVRSASEAPTGWRCWNVTARRGSLALRSDLPPR